MICPNLMKRDFDMTLIRMFLVFSLVFVLSGCASNMNIKSESIGLLEYGDQPNRVVNILENKGIPLFKFYSKSDEYDVVLFEPNDTYQRYIFLFENDQLRSVISEETGIRIWEQAYGSYKESIPSLDKFDDIVSQITEEKLDLQQTDFSKINVAKRDESRRDVSEAIAINLFMPLGLIGVIVTGPVLIPYTVNELNKAKESEDLFLKKVSTVKLNSSSDSVKSILGEAKNKYQTEEQTILMFHEDTNDGYYVPQIYLSTGFVNDELKWVGYYFNAGKRLSP